VSQLKNLNREGSSNEKRRKGLLELAKKRWLKRKIKITSTYTISTAFRVSQIG